MTTKGVKSENNAQWMVYILRCRDGTLYTGITNQLEKRLRQHNLGQGARYTRGRGPALVVYREKWPNRSLASRREAKIKKLSRRQKLALITASKATPNQPENLTANEPIQLNA